MKVTSGVLRARDEVRTISGVCKVAAILAPQGGRLLPMGEAHAGQTAALAGLSARPGERIGDGFGLEAPETVPLMSVQVEPTAPLTQSALLAHLREMEEEDPLLSVRPEADGVSVGVMGAVQVEVLQGILAARFGDVVRMCPPHVLYKETIAAPVVGIGHYEPLRHYAEVWLKLEPGAPGSGISFAADCPPNSLDENWQRLIRTHVFERAHPGVLTGSPLCDVRIRLIAGRAHLKHTEGGDFRQATYRAVRQGLMQADNVLLEPYYSFAMEIPAENVGRALNDIQKMHGEFEPPETDGDMTVITGMAPVSAMRDYQMEVTTYTRGRGRLFCTLDGYRPCADQDTVIEEIGYDPEADTENPAGSVFCSHGAGYYVPWNEVFSHMHIESQLKKRQEIQKDMTTDTSSARRKDRMTGKKAPSSAGIGWNAKEEKELEDIFIRTYGKIERRNAPVGQTVVTVDSKPKKHRDDGIEYLLVDGYNVIFAWDELKELAKDNIEAARNKLMDVLSNYQGFRRCVLILVFDAYKVDGEALEIQRYHNIHVVFTKEAETADQYIEKVVHEIGRKRHVTVVTSDGVEQVITTSQGAHLISAREFREEIAFTERQIREEWDRHRESDRNYLFDHMDENLVRHMEEVRLGRKNLK